MYHYIYKTWCIVNNKYYIGMHSTEALDDSYMGSGTNLLQSLEIYGIESHAKEILEFLPDRDSLALRESQIIDEILLSDPMCMNLVEGGEGSSVRWEINHGKLKHLNWRYNSKKQSEVSGFKNRFKYGRSCVDKIIEGNRKGGRNGPKQLNFGNGFAGRSHSQESKDKMAVIMREKQSGIKNSQFGTCWIYSIDEKRCKKIKKDSLDEWISVGLHEGRKMKFD